MNTQSSTKEVLILFVVAYTVWTAIQAWRNRSSPPPHTSQWLRVAQRNRIESLRTIFTARLDAARTG
jgi:hypothetical protein